MTSFIKVCRTLAPLPLTDIYFGRVPCVCQLSRHGTISNQPNHIREDVDTNLSPFMVQNIADFIKDFRGFPNREKVFVRTILTNF